VRSKPVLGRLTFAERVPRGPCLLCGGPIAHPQQVLQLSYASSLRLHRVDVEVCVLCTATRKMVLLDVQQLARRRAEFLARHRA
jgi:hypothetical protein